MTTMDWIYYRSSPFSLVSVLNGTISYSAVWWLGAGSRSLVMYTKHSEVLKKGQKRKHSNMCYFVKDFVKDTYNTNLLGLNFVLALFLVLNKVTSELGILL